MAKRISRIIFIGLLLFLSGSLRNVSITQAQAGPQANIFNLVNQLRASYGLPPFIWDNSLAVAAQNQANYMATNNIYSHVGEAGSSPASRAIAAGYPGHANENIVGGTNLTPSQGVTWWKNSPIHFNTMISDRYVHAGVGFSQGHDQNFYALVVGYPSDEAPDPVARNEQGEAFAPVAPIQLAAPREDGSIVHTVGPGQSFWAIAARYEISLDQLYLYNNLNENSVINPGDELIIRLAEGQLPPPTPTPPATHKVNEGDSLWTIAAWYNLSLPDLLWLNSMEEDSLLSPGDEIRIRLLPGEEPPATATPQIFHTIRSGDTAWGIAVEYGLSVGDLLSYNNLSSDAILSVGDTLLVVPPSLTPTITPFPTNTPLPTPTPVPTVTPTPSPASVLAENPDLALRPSPTALTAETKESPTGLPAVTIVIFAGFGLIGAGAIAFMYLKKT